jgi:multiple sugar transport system ATP-binding protein
LDLDIADGEFLVLVGPSGCGKSTSLRMLAGLEAVTEGRILIGDRDVTHLAPKERDIAMVFQNYALYPHMSVFDNMAFGLKLQKVPRPEIEARVGDAAQILGLGELLKRKPAALSGGQRQRVAMGRAIVRHPQAFLMDEPLSNLDAKLRVSMRASLNQMHERLGVTTVYVTHDQVEAMTLGDRVCVLRDGILQQVDTPQELYRHPINLFVAAFIGSPPMNLVEAEVHGDRVRFGGWDLPSGATTDLHAFDGKRVILGVRPSDMEDAAVWHESSLPTIDVTAEVTEELGSEVNVLFAVDEPPVSAEEIRAATTEEGDDELMLASEASRCVFCASVDARTSIKPGGTITLTLDPDRFHYFDPSTGRAVNAIRAEATA